jgi:hypothetical protein
MVSIISASISPRLQYVCDFIFTQYYQLPYELISEATHTTSSNLIFYGLESEGRKAIKVSATSLLSSTEIAPHTLNIAKTKTATLLYSIPETEIGFDIFSAVFYLISRYEEYLQTTPDKYGRFDAVNSVAYQNDFLHLPMVDIWLQEFKSILTAHFPDLVFANHTFSFLPTYDIDIAFSYRAKGGLRNIGGFLKSPSMERIKVLLGRKQDPYDCFSDLQMLHQRYQLEPIYFFLLAQKLGQYDKNIAPSSASLQQLIQSISKTYEVGIHPSWQSYLQVSTVNQEIKLLENITGSNISKSRQHYIRMRLPESYQTIIKCGITDDYSMGYGTRNGFRASTSFPYYWYDLSNEKTTSLKIHPFCYMDATSIFQSHHTVDEAFTEMTNLGETCQKYSIPFISIFHNNLLGADKLSQSYSKMYEAFMKEILK